jgi:acetolactate synthase-1/2/3 large subunit
VQMAELVLNMAELLPQDAIIANGAGNFAAWVHRFYPFRKFNTQVAPTSGSMGYGLPAALAAKALYPERAVICFTGDGDLMMTVQELATAVQHKLNIVIIVIDNGMYGTIRMHQEKNFPGRPYAVDLRNPDFKAMAESFGCAAYVVNKTEDFAPAFKQALQNKIPSLIHVKIDPEAITPSKSLSAIRLDAQRG